MLMGFDMCVVCVRKYVYVFYVFGFIGRPLLSFFRIFPKLSLLPYSFSRLLINCFNFTSRIVGKNGQDYTSGNYIFNRFGKFLQFVV